jgi:hypothetical protein
MLIVVKFRPRRDATEVVLVHAQLPSEQAGDNRRNGCAGCFPKLEQVLGQTWGNSRGAYHAP